VAIADLTRQDAAARGDLFPMWLFTTIGFFSVVEDGEHPNMLKIRARASEDLEALRGRYLPDLEIVETEHTDYRFRAFIQRDEWAHAAHALAADIESHRLTRVG